MLGLVLGFVLAVAAAAAALALFGSSREEAFEARGDWAAAAERVVSRVREAASATAGGVGGVTEESVAERIRSGAPPGLGVDARLRSVALELQEISRELQRRSAAGVAPAFDPAGKQPPAAGPAAPMPAPPASPSPAPARVETFAPW